MGETHPHMGSYQHLIFGRKFCVWEEFSFLFGSSYFQNNKEGTFLEIQVLFQSTIALRVGFRQVKGQSKEPFLGWSIQNNNLLFIYLESRATLTSRMYIAGSLASVCLSLLGGVGVPGGISILGPT